jgi:hypothetical protein
MLFLIFGLLPSSDQEGLNALVAVALRLGLRGTDQVVRQRLALGEAGGAPVKARGPVSKVFETEKKRFQMKIRVRQAGHIDESQGVEWPQSQPPRAL